MRILAVSNFYPPDVRGGYELGCEQAVEALRSRGHEVRVLTSGFHVDGPDNADVSRRLQLSDVWNPYVDSLSARSALVTKEVRAFQVNARNVQELTAELESFQPDVVYLWMLVGLGGLGLLGCLTHQGVPWAWHLMDEVPSKLCSTLFQVRPALAREFSRRFRGTFLACSQQILDAITQQGFDLGDDVEVVPNWFYGELPALRLSGWRPGEPLRIAAAAATIDRNYDKGIDILLRSASRLLARGHDNFTLDIFGKVTDAYFADLIRVEAIGQRVRLMGALERRTLIDAYQHYDVFAFPGRIGEPNAFAPLEAAACGCVPVLAREGGNAEWLVHGVHGLKAERTPEGFADGLERILDGGIDLAAMARRAATAVRRDFHLESLAPKIERALERAASRRGHATGTSAEAIKLARLAESISHILIQQPFLN